MVVRRLRVYTRSGPQPVRPVRAQIYQYQISAYSTVPLSGIPFGHSSNFSSGMRNGFPPRPELVRTIRRGQHFFFICVPHPSFLSVRLVACDMRLSRALLPLCLLFGARASQLDSRVPHALDTRELLDVCSTVLLESITRISLGITSAVIKLGLVGASIFHSNVLA